MPSILLLGASSDIATAIARKFAQNKYDIILAGRDTELLQSLKSDIEVRYHVRAEAIAFNAVDFSEHHFFYKSLPFEPDITVCVFGYLGDQKKAEKEWSEAEQIVQTNYVGAMSILKVISEDYAAKKRGVIVGISSVAGERGRQSNYVYGSAKAGFTTYLSGLRNHLHKYGVQVVTILPGYVYTRMTEHLKLPAFLTAQPEGVATAVKDAIENNKNIVYVKSVWRWIMLAIKLIPESMFKKMQL